MSFPVPRNTRLLLDHIDELGIQKTWQDLASGELPASHWRTSTGDFLAVPPSEWARFVSMPGDDGSEVMRHTAELLKERNLSWLRSSGGVVGSDPVIVPYFTKDELLAFQDAFVEEKRNRLAESLQTYDIWAALEKAEGREPPKPPFVEAAREYLSGNLGANPSRKDQDVDAPRHRPALPGKDWYQKIFRERGMTRGGRTLKTIRREIETATGICPGDQTVRDWENDVKNAR